MEEQSKPAAKDAKASFEKQAQETPNKSKDVNPNRNNYILAGISVAAVLIVALIICGLGLNWFNGVNTNMNSNGNSESLIASPREAVKHVTEEILQRTDLELINSSLTMYQTNNRGQLPTIPRPSALSSTAAKDEYDALSVDGTGNSELDNFYNEYLSEGSVSQNGRPYSINFYGSLNALDGDVDDLSRNDENIINIFYKTTCDYDDGGLKSVSGSRRFAIVAANASKTDIVCTSN